MNDYWMNLEPVKLQIKNWLEQATADGGDYCIKKILSWFPNQRHTKPCGGNIQFR